MTTMALQVHNVGLHMYYSLLHMSCGGCTMQNIVVKYTRSDYFGEYSYFGNISSLGL